VNAYAVESLLAPIRERIQDPERQRLALELAVDTADLQIRVLAGADVERELAHNRAQAAALSATEAEIVRQAFEGWLLQAKAAVVRGLVAAAAGS
jgi:hypothetical protein